jgi:hypothetical protein
LTAIAKVKSKQRRLRQPDLREIVELHERASKKLGELREEHQALLDAGEKTAAKEALRRMKTIQTVVRGLEMEVTQPPDS